MSRMMNERVITAKKVASGVLVALVAVVVLVFVLSRATQERENLPEWVRAWGEAGPEERVEIVRRMEREQPLKGLTLEECTRLLGPPDSASWRCGVTVHWLARWVYPMGEERFLDIDFDEDGFVEKAQIN